jgi:hypothetical protein
MNIRKIELESDDREFGTMYEIHVYLQFQKEPEILYLPTWAEGHTIITNILDFLKLLIERGA